MRCRLVLASVALAAGCGNHRDSAPAAPSQAAGSQLLEPPTLQRDSGARDAVAAGGASSSTAMPSDARGADLAIAEADRVGRNSAMRCTLRVSAKGIHVDGVPKSPAEAVAACKRTAGASVFVEDNARAGEWAAMRTALRREGVPILMRGPIGDLGCEGNPLAKGCM